MRSIPQDTSIQLAPLGNPARIARRRPPVEVTCNSCGEKFTRYASQVKGNIQFCSKVCYNTYKKLYGQPPRLSGNQSTPQCIMYTCDQCGTTFTKTRRKRPKNKHCFCSKQCYGKWQSIHHRGLQHPNHRLSLVKCVHCDKAAHKSKWEIHRHNQTFCGKTCYEAWRASKSRSENRTCVICGKSKRYDASKLERNKEFCCSKECSNILVSLNQSGENHWNWRGGVIPYYGSNWHRQRRRARARDGYMCQMCSKSEKELGRQLDVHHIRDFRKFGTEHYKEANMLSNLVSLCHRCHFMVTIGSATWPPTEQLA